MTTLVNGYTKKLYYHMKGCLQFMHDLYMACNVPDMHTNCSAGAGSDSPVRLEDKFNPFTTHQEFYKDEDGICLSIWNMHDWLTGDTTQTASQFSLLDVQAWFHQKETFH